MTEKEKMLAGMIYDANNDPQLIAERLDCKEKCYDYNHLRPKETDARRTLMQTILGHTDGDFLIEQPFLCDYGYNISIGRNFYANHNLVILDEAPVKFGGMASSRLIADSTPPDIPSMLKKGTEDWNMHVPYRWATTYGSGPMYASCQE